VYLSVDPLKLLPPWQLLLSHGSIFGVLIALLLAGLAYVGLRRPSDAVDPGDQNAPASRRLLAEFGIILTVVPAFMISISPFWWKTLYFSVAYFPVYLTGFGIALLIALAADAIVHRTPNTRPSRLAAMGVAAASFLVVLLTYRANAIIARDYDAGWAYPRNALADALRAGILAGVPPGSRIVFDHSYPFFFGEQGSFFWDARYLTYYYSRQRVNAVPLETLPALCANPAGCVLPPDTYTLHNVADAAHERVVVARVRSLSNPSSTGPAVARFDEARIFSRPALKQASLPAVRAESQRVLADGSLTSVHSSCGLTDVDELNDGLVTTISTDDGFYGDEHDAAAHWRWMRSGGTLILQNRTSLTRHARLTATFATIGASSGHVFVTTDGHMYRFPVDIAKVDTIPITLPAHGTVSLQLRTDMPRVNAPADPRDMHVQLRQFDVYDVADSCSSASHR
jgi:hypothetical protein